jgi:sugar phosphate permease
MPSSVAEVQAKLSGTPARATRQRLVLGTILFFAMVTAYIDRVNISILAASNAFLVDMGIKGQPVKIGMLMTLFLIAYAVGQLLLSPIGDYWGPRKAMCGAVILMAISMLVGGIGPTFMVMLLSRVVLGLGEGIEFPLHSTFVKTWFPPQERGKANAVWNVGTVLGPAVAMPFFAWIVASRGWHWSFFVCAVLGMGPLYLFWFHTTDTPREHKKVNVLELQHIEAGLTKEAQSVDEGKGESLWENVRLVISNYRVWLSIVIGITNYGVYWGLVTWLPTYLKTARGFSWTAMGILSSMPFILSIASKLIGGWASDYVGRRAPFCAIGALGAAISIYFSPAVANNYTSAVLISFGLGLQLVGTPLNLTMLQGFVPTRVVSLAAGIMGGISFGFASFVPALIGYTIGLTGSFNGGFYILVGMSLAGMIASLVLSIQKY